MVRSFMAFTLLVSPQLGQTPPGQVSQAPSTDFDFDHADLARLRADAKKGIPEALFNMGRCYARGKGVPKDPAEAAKWYVKAAHTSAARMRPGCFGVEKTKESPLNTKQAQIANISRWILSLVSFGLGCLSFYTSCALSYLSLGFGGMDSAQWEFAIPSSTIILLIAALLGRYAYVRAPAMALRVAIVVVLGAHLVPWAVIIFKFLARS